MAEIWATTACHNLPLQLAHQLCPLPCLSVVECKGGAASSSTHANVLTTTTMQPL